jgi:hypothetical protein
LQECGHDSPPASDYISISDAAHARALPEKRRSRNGHTSPEYSETRKKADLA